MARRFQSGLGTELTRRYKEGQRVDTIKLMSVVKVNYKYNTVDLVALYEKETFQGSYTNEGRYSAKLPMEFGGRNIAGQPYGEVNPIAVGTKVLVGFVEASKNNPIILAVYADNEVTEKLSRAPFSSADPRDEDLAQQMYQKFALYPSLTYDSIDGEGTRVVTFSGKSFVVFDTAAYNNATMVSDGNYGTTYEDLGSSFYADGEVIEPMEGRAPNVLFKHQGILDADDEPDNHDFMIHISPDGDYRTSIMNKEQDWRTYFEMDNEGQVRLRRQEDTVQLDAPQEIGEIVIDKYGVVSLRNGETNLEVRKDGLYSGGKPLGSALNLDLREIKDKISGINRDIISQNSRIGEIEGGFEVLSDKTEVIDGDLSKHEARLTVLSDEINSKVSRDQVDAIVNEGLEDISQDIRDIRAGTEEANKKIEGIADDNLVTPSEKKDLLGEWEIIQNEYPSYVDQANLYEVSSDAYESAYAQLKDFIEPILEDMNGVYPVDGTVLRNRFKSYYSSRLGLLEDVFKNFQEGIMEAMQEAAKAQTTALEAQTQIADTNEDLKHTNGLIDDISDDGMLTPSEKYQLRKEWQNIEAEHQTTLEQGQRYDVRTDQFELAHQLLENMLDPIFEEMRETISVDGNALRQRIQGYYEAKRDLLKEISDLNKEVMEDYGERIDHAETNINQTAEQIELMANRVQTIGNDLETALARIDVNADEISSRVTEETMYEFIDDKIADISVGGVNLYVVYTQTNGWLDSYTGEVRDPDNDSVVSDYIRVKGNTPYVISLFENTGNNTISVAWYNTTRRFISGDAVSGEDEFYEKYTSPEDAQFLRVSYKKSDVVKIKVETGTKPTDFDYAWEDVKNDQDLLEEYMRNIEKQAQKTEEKATDAEYNAKIANDELADLADDDILSPTDKKQAQLQWDQIQEEYPVNIEQANRFNASSESYKNSYETLERYIEPLIKYPEQKSVISGNTFRKTFSDYYTKRTTLLNRIAEIAQESAENANKRADNLDNEVSRVNEATKQAQIAAENAQESADKANQSVEVAQRDAQRANEEIADIADDNVLAPSEKQQLKYPWAEIKKEYPKNVIQAQEFNTSSESYENAYKDLESFAEPLFNKMDEKSVVDGSILQDKFGEYYDQRVDLLNAISNVAKNRADKAQEDLDNLDINDRNILLDSKKRTIERSNSDHKYIIYQLSEEELTKNKFVFSGKVEVTNGSYDKFTATFADEANTNLGSYEISLGEEGRFSYAITSDKVKNATEIHVYAGINGSTSNNAADLLNFKLQEGNRATAWTPAPEDTRDEALNLARKYTDSQIDITTDAINLSVEETKEYADSSSNKAEQNAKKYSDTSSDRAEQNAKDYADSSSSKAREDAIEYARDVKQQALDAQRAAENAQNDADVANEKIADIGDDEKVTPGEKKQLQMQWSEIQEEYQEIKDQATRYSLSTSSYTNSYNQVASYVEDIFENMGSTTSLSGETLRATFSRYYGAKTTLLNQIYEKAEQNAKDYSDTRSDRVEENAKDYTDNSSNKAEQNAKDYSDSQIAKVGKRIQQAEDQIDESNKILVDMSKDDVLSPIDKKSLSKEWEQIQSEYPKLIEQGNKYGTNVRDIEASYGALEGYLTPIISQMGENTEINSKEFRSKFKEYYDDKLNLMNDVSDEVRKLGDAAAENAEQNAKDYSDTEIAKVGERIQQAEDSIDESNKRLTEMSQDDILSPIDKKSLAKEWKQIESEYPKLIEQANSYSVSTSGLETTYTSLQNYVEPLLGTMGDNSAIAPEDFRLTFKNYYDDKLTLMNNISDKVRKLGDAAASDAENRAKDYSDTSSDRAEQNAKNYADSSSNKAEQNAKVYTDNQIDITTDGIKLSVEETKEYADSSSNKAEQNAKEYADSSSNKAEQNAKDYTDSQIDITKEGIVLGYKKYTDESSQKVKDNAKSYADNAVDSIDINDRNLIVVNKLKAHTDFTTAPKVEKGGRKIWVKWKTHPGNLIAIKVEGFKPEGLYTLSARIEINGKPVTSSRFPYKKIHTSYQDSQNERFDISDDGRLIATEHFNENDNGYIIYTFMNDMNEGDTVTFYDLKFQKGNKATDWTPAPEDLVEEATNESKKYTDNQISITEEGIKSKVDKDGVISQINQSSEGVLIDGAKNHITGKTKIDNAVITSAMIKDIDASRVTVSANSGKKSVRMTKDGFVGYDSSGKLRLLIGVQDLAGDGQSDPSNVVFYSGNGKKSVSVGTNVDDTFVIGSETSGINGLVRIPKQLTLESDDVIVKGGTNKSDYGDYWRFGTSTVGGTKHVVMTTDRPYAGVLGHSNRFLRKIYTTDADIRRLDVGYGFNNPQEGDFSVRKDSRSGFIMSKVTTTTRTYDVPANVRITRNGVFGKAISASKYKLNIQNLKQEEALDLGNRLLTLNPSKWWSKDETEGYVSELDGDDDFVDENNVSPYYGMVAEDLRDVGLDPYIEYDEKTGEIEGIQYDRLWTPLIPIIREQRAEIEKLKIEVEKLKRGGDA